MKKRTVALFLGVVMLFSITACGGEESASDDGNEVILETAEDYLNALKEAGCPITETYIWTEETDPNNLLGRPNQYVSKADFMDSSIDPEMKLEPLEEFGLPGGTVEVFDTKGDCEDRYEYLKSFDDPSLGAVGLNQYMYKNENVILRVSYDVSPSDAKVYESAFNALFGVGTDNSESSKEETESGNEEISQQEEISEPQEEQTPPDNANITLSQKNALEKAESYLSFMPFSHEGLVSQLEYDGFPVEDAVFAADNCRADWKEQASKKAINYIKNMAFSHDGLIGQLEYDGFSNEEATYAADNCGADWNEQAAKKAQSYINIMPFSRSSLVDQLIYDGFSQEQADYGATAVGF